MTIEVTQRPLFLTARNHVYDAWDLRNMAEHHSQGAGVIGREDFRVMQRQAGSNLSVDIGITGVGRMRAWVRGTTRGGQGLYLVDNVDRNFPGVDTYLPQLNHPVAANATGLPRVDAVYLQVLDQQHAGGANDAVIDVKAGTATAGADLVNRNGAPTPPASALWLADLLVPSGATSPSLIYDRRHVCAFGRSPGGMLPGAYGYDGVVPTPIGGIVYPRTLPYNDTINNYLNVAAVEIKSRIKASVVRWGYGQSFFGSNLVTGTYWWEFFDSSGRLVASTGTGTITGATAAVAAADALAAVTTFEPGVYYAAFSFRGLGRANTSNSPSLLFSGIQPVPGCIGSFGYQTANPGQLNNIDFGTILVDPAAAGASTFVTPGGVGVPVVPQFLLSTA